MKKSRKLSLGLAGVLAAAGAGCTAGDIYKMDSDLAFASGQPGLGILLGAAGDSMRRQENMQHELNVAREGRSQIIIINGQAYAPANIPQPQPQPVYIRPRLPGPIDENFYVCIADGAIDRNGDGMIGDDELIGGGKFIRKKSEGFGIFVKYAGSCTDWGPHFRAALKEKGLKGAFKWEGFTLDPMRNLYGNCWFETFHINPGQLKPGKYEVIRQYIINTEHLFDVNITE